MVFVAPVMSVVDSSGNLLILCLSSLSCVLVVRIIFVFCVTAVWEGEEREQG